MSIVCMRFKSYESESLKGFCDLYIEKWGIEIAICSVYLVGGVCVFVFAIKREKPTFPAIYGSVSS